LAFYKRKKITMKKGLAKIRKLEGKRLAAVSRARSMARQAAVKQQHTIVAGGTSFGIGFAENQGFKLPTIAGIDPALLLAAGALAGSLFIKDATVRKVLEGLTDGLVGVVGYKAGKYGFNSLFSYSPSAALPKSSAGWGEEIIETGAF
jgi:hypothetical protein